MRTLLAALVLCTGLVSLAGCTSNPNSPAIKAFEPVNACGPGGTSDEADCPGGGRR